MVDCLRVSGVLLTLPRWTTKPGLVSLNSFIMYMKTRPAPSAAVSAYEPDDEGRASFRHNFWETARKNPGIRIVIYFSVPPPLHSHRGEGCPCCFDVRERASRLALRQRRRLRAAVWICCHVISPSSNLELARGLLPALCRLLR